MGRNVRVPAQQTGHGGDVFLSSSLGGSMQAQCKGKRIVTILHTYIMVIINIRMERGGSSSVILSNQSSIRDGPF